MQVTLFRSRLRQGMSEADTGKYYALLDELKQAANEFPGFLGIKSYTADDGERMTVVRFETADQQRKWREWARHKEAQMLGREEFYEEYTIEILEKTRGYSWSRE